MQETREAKFYKASKMLQAKVGTGVVEREKVEVCEQKIAENNTDFSPMAKQFLDKLEKAVKKAQSGEEDLSRLKQNVTEPVMQLKANGSMFGYTLIGDLANIMLSFLENVSKLDDDIIAIIDAHHKTLSVIVHNQMSGDGGENGKAMKTELMNACKRYMEKRANRNIPASG
jgi:hypothetical protein